MIRMVIILPYAIAQRFFIFGFVSCHLDTGANLSIHRFADLPQKAGGERNFAARAFAAFQLFFRSAFHAASVAGLLWPLQGAEVSRVAPRLVERFFDLVGRLDWMRHRRVRL